MKRQRVKTLIEFFLLHDDEEEEMTLELLLFMSMHKRKKTHEMIVNREKEGAFCLLVQKYLLTEEDKFVKYFRVSSNLFYMILEHISCDLVSKPCNRNPNPISAEQKLCLTLR